MDGKKVKLVAVNLWRKKMYSFSCPQDAADFTKITEARIRVCLQTGQRWKGWRFMLVEVLE